MPTVADTPPHTFVRVAAGLRRDSWACRACARAERLSLVLFRIIPHALITVALALTPSSVFGSPAYYGLALLVREHALGLVSPPLLT